MRRSLESIFNHYGNVKQLEKFSCEVIELSLAIHRFKEENSHITLDQVTDEISDVMNMMDQFIMFHGIGHEIEMIRAKKIERTLRKIIEEKETEKKELQYDNKISDEVF